MSVRYIPKHKVQGALLLNVVVAQRATVLELLTSEDQTLLVRRNALLVLNLGLHIVNRVRGLNLERDRLASQGLDEDLHGRQRLRTTLRKRARVQSPVFLPTSLCSFASVTCRCTPMAHRARGTRVLKFF